MFDPKNAGKIIYAVVLILSVIIAFLIGSLNSSVVWPWFFGGLFLLAVGLPFLLLDIPAKWEELDILKQLDDIDNKDKNIKTLLTIFLALLVILSGFNGDGNFLPWFVAGIFIIFVIVPLQRIDNLLIHDGKLLGILKRWDDLDEKGKFYRSLWFAIPETVLALFATKNPFLAGVYFICLIWVAIRRLQKWQKLQDEESL